MSKKPIIDQKDIDAFKKAVEGARPLPQEKVRLAPPTPKYAPKKPTALPEEASFCLSDEPYLPAVPGDGLLLFARSGISNKILRKLRKGQYNVDAILDLHGMTVEEAKIAVYHFLKQCVDKGIRVVLIIHGKGHHSHEPILKNKLNHWLREIEIVLAFCSAAPRHGSRGALYALLKST